MIFSMTETAMRIESDLLRQVPVNISGPKKAGQRLKRCREQADSTLDSTYTSRPRRSVTNAVAPQPQREKRIPACPPDREELTPSTHNWQREGEWGLIELKLCNAVLREESFESFMANFSESTSKELLEDDYALNQLLHGYASNHEEFHKDYSPYGGSDSQRFMSRYQSVNSWQFYLSLRLLLKGHNQESTVEQGQASTSYVEKINELVRSVDSTRPKRKSVIFKETMRHKIETVSSMAAPEISAVSRMDNSSPSHAIEEGAQDLKAQRSILKTPLARTGGLRRSMFTADEAAKMDENAKIASNKERSIKILTILLDDVLVHTKSIEMFHTSTSKLFVPIILHGMTKRCLRIKSHGALLRSCPTVNQINIANLPFINLTCKQDEGDSIMAHAKVSAQILAQSLGILQKRLDEIKQSIFACPHEHTWIVFTVVVHGLKAYLVKIKFTQNNWIDIHNGKRNRQEIEIAKSPDCRLDQPADVANLLTLLYHLVQQMKHDVLEEQRAC